MDNAAGGCAKVSDYSSSIDTIKIDTTQQTRGRLKTDFQTASSHLADTQRLRPLQNPQMWM
ncbi:hypothetical protein [Neisseria sp. 74A18]|uniref:hypothetical protein n=1 Tax=Neisseria sp. 74A18 TaxID=1696094 RepID=UPI000B0601A2|nr:hypothetical protein [Neisseria sp. 74A18]